MSRIINIHEAKTHLSRLVDEVAGGEEIIIAKAGKPMVRLTPLSAKSPQKFGLLKGEDSGSGRLQRAARTRRPCHVRR
jgi:prevent-host-death family protein